MNKQLAVNIGTSFGSPFGVDKKLGDLVGVIIQNSMIAAGVILLFFLVGAGIAIIQGAGSGDANQTAKGQKAATMAIAGFIIIFVAYWIIRLIEEITGTKFVTNPGGI